MNRWTMLALLALPLAAAAHAEDRWKKADTDGDGRVSKSEADAASPRLAGAFARIDADSDGFLTAGEFEASRQLWREEHRRQAREKFVEADKDGDGALDLAEAQASLPMLAGKFTEIDADGDGKVTAEELRALRGRHVPERH